MTVSQVTKWVKGRGQALKRKRRPRRRGLRPLTSHLSRRSEPKVKYKFLY